MPLSKDFPDSPHAVLDPAVRWVPEDAHLAGMEPGNLMPPLVKKLRGKVRGFRDGGYAGASETSRALLDWWFNRRHLLPQGDGTMAEFRYYFAQREAVETIVYLCEVVGVRDKHDMLRFDSSGAISSGMFKEDWRRFVVKLATGCGKTKVLSLVLAWSFFHRTYEEDSDLSRNFLVIAPNIIVLDRIRRDFEGLRIFHEDPVLPDNGHHGRNWRDDFQLRLHIQDEVRITQPIGNIFLTNIHRVYTTNEALPSPDDANSEGYYLGKKPRGATTDSRADLGMIVRDIDELAVLNDEAHHIHNEKLAWSKCIRDIHNQLLQRDGKLAFQVDTTATPRHNNGSIFVQTVADYPLVEAIAQGIVKHPVLPDRESRDKLREHPDAEYTRKYADYINLGIVEWQKAHADHRKMGKKAILFVMTDDTKSCDEVSQYLQQRCADLQGKVLVIHTRNNGDISETQKDKKELEQLRKQANEIDSPDNPHLAIVSVMMLKEGWDVRNVTTIVGLRPYGSKSKVLPEQTLGRGLRKMYSHDTHEVVSVIGINAFMEFVEEVQAEGVKLEQVPMGKNAPSARLLIEIDPSRDRQKLDISLPVLRPRLYREYGNLGGLNVACISHSPITLRDLKGQQGREIAFKFMTRDEHHHKIVLEDAELTDYRRVLRFFVNALMEDMRLVSGYDMLYARIKEFCRDRLFGRTVDLDDERVLRNLSEAAAIETVVESFRRAINALITQDRGTAAISGSLDVHNTRPFAVKNQRFIAPKKSLFNRITGDSGFELEFAYALERYRDVAAFAKNYLALGFKLDYIKDNGDIRNYYPDFLVRLADGTVVIVETKGLEDIDARHKAARLAQWCADVNAAQQGTRYAHLFVEQQRFARAQASSFGQLLEIFRKYQNERIGG